MIGGALARRPRRHDPGRRDRLVATALDVIAERGAAATTHRAVAQAADVPLGSLTYHFASLTDLLAAAFTLHVEQVAQRFDDRMCAAADRDAAMEALVRYLSRDVLTSQREVLVAIELYLTAARQPALRAVTQDWMARSQRSLQRHLDPVTARQVDALFEGLLLHDLLGAEPLDETALRAAVHRLAGTS